jgi:hypothetical protein
MDTSTPAPWAWAGGVAQIIDNVINMSKKGVKSSLRSPALIHCLLFYLVENQHQVYLKLLIKGAPFTERRKGFKSRAKKWGLFFSTYAEVTINF